MLPVGAEKDVGGGGEDLVSNGVQQLPKGGDEVELACEVAIEEVADGGHNEGDQGDSIADRAAPRKRDHEDACQDEA